MIDVFVGQIMTENLVTIDQSQTLTDAGVVMTDEDIKSVVVSDTEDRPIGILTSTDFVRMAGDGNTPDESTVSEYMTSDIVTTTVDTSVDGAADLMLENNISHLPVVKDDDSLIGIVTTTDIATYVSGAKELMQQ